ncbi:DUF4440 domain-containing protein [Pantoea sp.]|uniref:DUF4440 domain-containing protein n=1 Tax=Pantoea sp. TaxID=69393 RepID=UPI0031D29DC3
MNRYLQEVRDAHVLIQRWLGDVNADDALGDALLARFSASFSMVTPHGALLDVNALRSFFRAQRGARPDLQITIAEARVLTQHAHGATVFYQEWQQLPGQPAMPRFSTAVLTCDDAGEILWQHLHETAQPVT